MACTLSTRDFEQIKEKCRLSLQTLPYLFFSLMVLKHHLLAMDLPALHTYPVA